MKPTNPTSAQSALREAYLEAVGLGGKEKLQARLRAFELAHDQRKFEIDLLWKRSAYLWGFQIVSFAGFSAIAIKSAELWSEDDKTTVFLIVFAFQLLVSFFGLAGASLWYATASSSRVWFYNWEKHIDFLEFEFSGDIYKTL